ncbi:hypothetical protein Glove_227g121 [Diversispora epigaea]|uniref:Uncharacterized protein n=1 Tax=Diversispora epigaea TaxID=1348612 RepID=A0A397IE53_9GLOM|nr:hypothetical protein Glove_227g121 [Diversispora epigaea]
MSSHLSNAFTDQDSQRNLFIIDNFDTLVWIVSDVDISKICLKYHAKVIKRYEPMAVILDAFEKLLKENPCGLCEHFDNELWKDLFVKFQELYLFFSISDMIYDLFVNIIKITCKIQNRKEWQAVARSYLKTYGTTTEEKKVMVEIFKDFFDNMYILDDLVSLGKMMKCALDKSIKDDVDNLVIYGLQIIGGFDNMYILDDLVSLGKMMKCALDKSIKDDVDNLVIYGLQIIGG